MGSDLGDNVDICLISPEVFSMRPMAETALCTTALDRSVERRASSTIKSLHSDIRIFPCKALINLTNTSDFASLRSQPMLVACLSQEVWD